MSKVLKSASGINQVDLFALTGHAAVLGEAAALQNTISLNSLANNTHDLVSSVGKGIASGITEAATSFCGDTGITLVADASSMNSVDVLVATSADVAAGAASAATKALNATEGNDVIKGTGNADNIQGLGGNDKIYGGAGKDTLDGGAGHDKLYGGNDNDTIYGGAGNDEIFGGTGSDSILGLANDDSIYGDDGDDRLFGGDGVDRLYGGKGNDYIEVGAGGLPYTLKPTGAFSELLAPNLVNSVFQNAYGGDGNDTMVGYTDGNFTLYAGNGNDKLYAYQDDSHFSNSGTSPSLVAIPDYGSRVYGENGNDFLSDGAQKFNEYLRPDTASNVSLYGGKGSDQFEINHGATAYGGAGVDIYKFSEFSRANGAAEGPLTAQGKIDTLVGSEDKIHLAGVKAGGQFITRENGWIEYNDAPAGSTIAGQTYIIHANHIDGNMSMKNFIFDEPKVAALEDDDLFGMG